MVGQTLMDYEERHRQAALARRRICPRCGDGMSRFQLEPRVSVDVCLSCRYQIEAWA